MSTPAKKGMNAVLGGAAIWIIMGGLLALPTYVTHLEQQKSVHNFRHGKSLPGSAIDHELEGLPVPDYGHLQWPKDGEVFETQVENWGFSLSANLSLAAREVNRFYREHRRLVPSDVLSFILDSSGATYWGVQQTALVTTDQGHRVLETLIREQRTQENLGWDIGISDWSEPGENGKRVVIILMAERTITLDPVARIVDGQSPTKIRGRLAQNYSKPYVLAMSPQGKIEELPVLQVDQFFSVDMPRTPGKWVVEIMATGPAGPIPLTQMSFYVNEDIPRRFLSQWPPDESTVTDRETYLLGLINRSRERYGLQALTRREALDTVASRHSSDMAVHQFVGHVSERTGTLTQRMSRVNHPRVVYGENVALNTTISDAHLGLMNSLGHRKNLLSPDYTEIGIGIVRGAAGWYVTEVFNHPGTVQRTTARTQPPSDHRPPKYPTIVLRESAGMEHWPPEIR